eukprot:8517993-Pyramimonas_sp.AAC.1
MIELFGGLFVHWTPLGPSLDNSGPVSWLCCALFGVHQGCFDPPSRWGILRPSHVPPRPPPEQSLARRFLAPQPVITVRSCGDGTPATPTKAFKVEFRTTERRGSIEGHGITPEDPTDFNLERSEPRPVHG